MPGVTLVSSTNDHAAGHRKPSTMAAASRMWTLAMRSSMRNGAKASIGSHHGPTSHR